MLALRWRWRWRVHACMHECLHTVVYTCLSAARGSTQAITHHMKYHSEEEGGDADDEAAGEGGPTLGEEEEGLLTMEECLAEFVSYQSVSASEEDFHKEGKCVACERRDSVRV